MGLYDTVVLDESLELPRFPEALDPTTLGWQTEDLRQQSGNTFKISDEGRLLRQETAYREKTDVEKHREANNHGFETWDDYVAAVHNQGSEDHDIDLPAIVRSQVTVNSRWVDYNYHGSFEFHAPSPADSLYDDTWRYEARFSHGKLDEFTFLGDQDGGDPDDIDM